MESNVLIGKCVCIDWDIYYSDFLNMAKSHTLALIYLVNERMGMKAEVHYQESASGNVHIRLRFPQKVTVLEAFLIRAWMADDETRLRLDLARYFKTGSLHEMNRCFQSKIKFKGGQATLKEAGPWIKFEEDRDLPAVTTPEAHAFISNLQEERRHHS